MERRDSPQESHGLCHRLFRLIMNSLAFQSLKRIALRCPGDQYVPISTIHQNKDHSVADGSFSTGKNLIEVQKDGEFGNENSTLIAVEAANGHKASIRKKGGRDDQERLNGKVIDTNTIPVEFLGMVDKGARTEGRGATARTSKVPQEGDPNIVPVIMKIGGTSKRDDGKNTTYLTIDEKAQQFIIQKRASHSRAHSTNESKSGGPQKKKPHP